MFQVVVTNNFFTQCQQLCILRCNNPKKFLHVQAPAHLNKLISCQVLKRLVDIAC